MLPVHQKFSEFDLPRDHVQYEFNVHFQRMETEKIEESDLKFPIPSNIIVSGPSNSGKTQLVLKLLKNADDMFVPPPKAIGFGF